MSSSKKANIPSRAPSRENRKTNPHERFSVRPDKRPQKPVQPAMEEETSAFEYNGVSVKVVNRSKNPLPKYETPGSAAMDVRSAEEVKLMPGVTKAVKTGLFFQIPKGYQISVRPRSGLALKEGIMILNSPGLIDCVPGDSVIRISQKKSMTINEVIETKTTEIISFNESKNIIENDFINEVRSVGEKDLYEIELENGKRIQITDNELIYTKNGMKTANLINIDDELFFI